MDTTQDSAALLQHSGHAAHAEAESALSVHALPHHPWQQGTNENDNGLLRERFPKQEPLEVRVAEVGKVHDKINPRPASA